MACLDGERVELASNEVLVTPQPKAGFAVQAEGEYVVALDTNVTPELRVEGLAREFVRHVQDLRKSAGFDIADRIFTYYAASENLAKAVKTFADYIKGETLSVDLVPGAAPANAASVKDEFDGEQVTIAVSRASTESKRVKKAAKKSGRKVAKKAQKKMARTSKVRRGRGKA